MSAAGRLAALVVGLVMGGFLVLISPDQVGWIAACVVVATMLLFPLGIDALERWCPPDERER